MAKKNYTHTQRSRNIVTMFSATPSQVNTYSVDLDRENKRPPTLRQLAALENNEQEGLISTKAARRIRRAIDWLVFTEPDKDMYHPSSGNTYKFKINFVTLTLPSKQVHTDAEIKEQCLNQFLTELRQAFPGLSYLWRAESQMNGNIHFHITTNRYLPWQMLRGKWNRIIEKLGYVSAYQKKMISFFENGFKYQPDVINAGDYATQKRRYESGKSHNWRQPNSTDVHKTKNIRNISAYLSKYCSKNNYKYSCSSGPLDPETPLSKLADEQIFQMNFVIENGRIYNIRKQDVTYKTISDIQPATLAKAGIAATPVSRLIEGNLWGLSQNLSQFSAFRDIMPETVAQELRKLEVSNPKAVKAHEFCRSFYLRADWLNSGNSNEIRRYISQHAASVSKPKQHYAALGLFNDLPPDVPDKSASPVKCITPEFAEKRNLAVFLGIGSEKDFISCDINNVLAPADTTTPHFFQSKINFS